MKTKQTSVNEITIEKSGKFTVETTEVEISTNQKKGMPGLVPGKYKVDIAACLDKIIDKEPLFSHLVRKLTIVESVDIPSTATDGVNLYWNEDFLSSIPQDQQCGVLLHEVLHNAFLHLWRCGKRDKMLWNIACDYAINLIVNKSWSLPPGTLLDTQYRDMSAEEIYDRLPVKKSQQQGWCEKDDWDNNSSGKQSQQQQQQQQQGQGQGNGKPKKGKGSGGGLIDEAVKALKRAAEQRARQKAKGSSESQKEREWEQAFDKAFTKNYGKAPSYIKRLVSQRHYIPVINWAELVSNILSEDITDYTFSQPDRRFLEADFVLPELYSWDRVKDVVFAYDTSGSISSSDLDAYHKETRELFKQFTNLTGWAAVCDAYLHSFKEIQADVTMKEINFMGGGGTAFEPVFDEIEKKNIRPKAIFYFTDTYGSFPKDPGYPVFWLVHSRIGDDYDYQVPFGKVIKFMNRADLDK